MQSAQQASNHTNLSVKTFLNMLLLLSTKKASDITNEHPTSQRFKEIFPWRIKIKAKVCSAYEFFVQKKYLHLHSRTQTWQNSPISVLVDVLFSLGLCVPGFVQQHLHLPQFLWTTLNQNQSANMAHITKCNKRRADKS